MLKKKKRKKKKRQKAQRNIYAHEIRSTTSTAKGACLKLQQAAYCLCCQQAAAFVPMHVCLLNIGKQWSSIKSRLATHVPKECVLN